MWIYFCNFVFNHFSFGQNDHFHVIHAICLVLKSVTVLGELMSDCNRCVNPHMLVMYGLCLYFYFLKKKLIFRVFVNLCLMIVP